MTFSLVSLCKQTLKVLLGGVQILTASISLSVLAVLWLVGVPIYLLLTTLIPNKKLSREEQMYLSLRGSGFNQDRSND